MMRRFAAAGLLAALIGGMIGGQAAATGAARPAAGCWDPEPCPITLYAVDMLSAAEGWAVGEGGTILRWDGRRWRPQASPTTQTLRAVSMVSASDGWAAGANGTLLRWNGSAWAPQALGITDQIYDLDMRSATEGWMATATSVRRWDGAQWAVSSQVPAFSISASAANDVWAGSQPPQRWDGSQWHPSDRAAQINAATKTFGPTDAWVGGGSCQDEPCSGWIATLRRWNGSSWQVVQGIGFGFVNSIDGVAGNDVWVVGSIDPSRLSPALFHWDGAALHTIFTDNTLYGVSMVSATDGWAAGAQGALLRWNGSQWTAYAPVAPRAYLPLLGR